MTLVTDLNVFATFRPKLAGVVSQLATRFPREYRSHAAAFRARTDQRHGRKLVALDTMNYWIEGAPAELRAILKRTDVLMINDAETRMLSSEHNLLRAARHIFSMGPRTLIIKRGEHGALMVDSRGVFAVPAFPLEEVHDPTGAGDSFAGGFMGYLASSKRHVRRRAAARDGLRLGDGQLCRRAVRPGTPAEGHAARNRCARTSLRQTHPVPIVSAPCAVIVLTRAGAVHCARPIVGRLGRNFARHIYRVRLFGAKAPGAVYAPARERHDGRPQPHFATVTCSRSRDAWRTTAFRPSPHE